MQISDSEKKEILSVLKLLSEGVCVFVFGSRATNKARRFSDLDLLIKGDQCTDFKTLAVLEEEFSESNLPYRTDLVDWFSISSEFKNKIQPDLVQIWP